MGFVAYGGCRLSGLSLVGFVSYGDCRLWGLMLLGFFGVGFIWGLSLLGFVAYGACRLWGLLLIWVVVCGVCGSWGCNFFGSDPDFLEVVAGSAALTVPGN